MDTNTNFKVEERPVTPNGLDTPVEGWKALVRTDNNEVLHLHRDSYTILPHEDVISSTKDAIKKAGFAKNTEFKAYCLDGGRQLQVEVLFNDLVVEPEVGDHVKFRIRAYNSYNGSWAYQTSTDALRLWCKNGCTHPNTLTKTWMRHTSQINLDGVAEKIKLGVDTFFNQKEVWQQWKKNKVDKQNVENFFKANLVDQKTNTSCESFNKRQLENLMGQLNNEFDQLGKNQWAVYNCMTHWATHTQDAKNPNNVTRDRENKLVMALRSPHWDGLALAA